jgi:hypothetical protein
VRFLVCTMCWLAVLAAGAGGALADEDSVTGSAILDDCPAGCFNTSIDAHSGPVGENPTGTADWGLRVNRVGGPVTCLTVRGNRAVVGGQSVEFLGPGFLFVVEDNAASGGPDRFAVADAELPEPPSSCPAPDDLDVSLVPALSGDLVVHDAVGVPTSKEQCKAGGWQRFGFKNQGQCVAFVQRAGGKP